MWCAQLTEAIKINTVFDCVSLYDALAGGNVSVYLTHVANADEKQLTVFASCRCTMSSRNSLIDC